MTGILRKITCNTCQGVGSFRRSACQDCSGRGHFMVDTPEELMPLSYFDALKMSLEGQKVLHKAALQPLKPARQ